MAAVSDPAVPSSLQREDLAGQVAHFRVRRNGLRQGARPEGSLEFDFSKDGDAVETAAGEQEGSGSVSEFGFVAGGVSHAGSEAALLDSISLHGRDAEVNLAHASDTEEWTIESGIRGVPGEILLDDSGSEDDVPLEPALPASASIGRRFIAGLLDLLLLSGSAAFFVAVFRAAGGRFHPQPAELVVAGFVGLFFVVFYLALFGSLAFATPGERWCGMVIRNLDGDSPTPQESLWRVVGYVVSASALMLGFIWALVDSDGLTWHDRISGTYLSCAAANPNDTYRASGRGVRSRRFARRFPGWDLVLDRSMRIGETIQGKDLENGR